MGHENSTTQKPDFVKISDYDEGLLFYNVQNYSWETPVYEYIARIHFRVPDVKKMIERCQSAWNNETGIFLQYVGLSDKKQHKVRIANCTDATAIDEEGNFRPRVEFTLALKYADYEDYQNSRKKR